jgi:phenylalanyl-tRNA synthetase beta chain
VGIDVPNAGVLSSIREAAGPLLKEARLVDRYAGGQIPQGKVSMTYRLEYRDPKKTLEEKDVAMAHSNILEALARAFGAQLR